MSSITLGKPLDQAPLSAADQDFAQFVVDHSIDADPRVVERSVRYGNQISAITDELAGRFPDSFLKGSVEHDLQNPSVAAFSFSGEAPASARALIAALPFQSQLIQGMPFSAKRLQEVHMAAYTAIRSNPLVAQATSSADAERGEITITTRLSAPTTELSLTAALDEVLKTRFGNARLPRVRVLISDAPLGGNSVLTGGTNINSSQGNCTSGFTVRVANNTRRVGLSTAAHCPDGMNYEGRPVLRYEGELLAPKGDLQWHELTTTEGIRNYIVYETGSRTRKVIAYGNPADGLYMCRWGRTNLARCDYVTDTSGGICSVDGYCGLFATKDKTDAPGDSGGPWWSGSGADAIARGVHSGWLRDLSGKTYNIFSPVMQLPNQFGLLPYVG